MSRRPARDSPPPPRRSPGPSRSPPPVSAAAKPGPGWQLRLYTVPTNLRPGIRRPASEHGRRRLRHARQQRRGRPVGRDVHATLPLPSGVIPFGGAGPGPPTRPSPPVISTRAPRARRPDRHLHRHQPDPARQAVKVLVPVDVESPTRMRPGEARGHRDDLRRRSRPGRPPGLDQLSAESPRFGFLPGADGLDSCHRPFRVGATGAGSHPQQLNVNFNLDDPARPSRRSPDGHSHDIRSTCRRDDRQPHGDAEVHTRRSS